jgi:stage III sporulation protein AE
MLAFTLYLSLTSMTANTADAAIVRSAKTTVAAMLPVVGSIAGDAASSLLAAAAVIRQAVGSFGLLAVCAIVLTPFLQTGLRCLLLKGVSAISSELAEGRLALLLRRLSESMALLTGCIGSCALLLFFSVYSMLRTVGT